MLSRTADNLYWVSRYVERAEFLARILDATARLATLPTAYGGKGNEWESTLLTSGAAELFHQHYDEANERNVTHFLAFSPDNPSSIRSCMERARANARAVRTALTGEMWETINSSYLELRRYNSGDMNREQFARFLEWVKTASLTFDGSAYRTMLRNDSYWFSRLGVYMERADNTARILDVKYHVLLPETEQIGGSLDYFQWSTILREVSALTAYHWVYRQSVQPWLVADLLIFNRQMPRSLASSYENIVLFLDNLARAYGRQGPSQRLSRTMMAKFENMNVKEVFQQVGLHDFISSFIVDNDRLGSAITEQYLV
ncbi:alpha-E domain-containing protein [Alsobacter sp. SYSU M60028]|uniref:Alpha-E domain-containing protein n=1 Tax=Alsobacter ponti TaxID=2962936 RepID=A0ABT1LG32_9HYPH|nr:alpha-E domain-containing protein [Alsobacter ponti]MCP8940462.1 alpha-E domain-containing protein [Alsobacter ponti]